MSSNRAIPTPRGRGGSRDGGPDERDRQRGGRGRGRRGDERGRGRGRGQDGERGRGRGRGQGGERARGRGQGGNRPDRAPGNVCDFFWATGSCRRGFECTFRHEIPNAAGTPSEAPRSNDAVDFFSTEGLASQNGIVRFNMKPMEVHNHLITYLSSNTSAQFAYSSPYRIESFVRILGSLNSSNQSWSMEMAQKFLDTVVQGDTLRLIEQVLHWENVSSKSSGNHLSFQRGYFPMLEFFVSEHIIKSTMHQNVNQLYVLMDNHYARIHAILMGCLTQMIDAGNWKDQAHFNQTEVLSGISIFKVIGSLYSEYILRFKSAFRQHPEILTFVEALWSLFERWSTAVESTPPTFDDIITKSTPEVRRLTLRQLRKELSVLLSIACRECGVAEEQRRPPESRSRTTLQQAHSDFVALLQNTNFLPGELRTLGPRHNNDFVNIDDVHIAPTHEELLSPIPPYLPYFVEGGPHHLPSNSMQKHLDIQFRLLREEMIATIRQSINAVTSDLSAIETNGSKSGARPTILETLLKARGGAYRTSGYNSVFFHLYTKVVFTAAQAERQNFFLAVQLDAPPGNARSTKSSTRKEYWEHSRRLSTGNLIALLLISSNVPHIYLGTIVSSSSDIAESSKASMDRIELRIFFFNPEIELYGLKKEKMSRKGSQFDYGILIDNSVLFDSIRPFLNTLQKVEPTSIPFSEYIASETSLNHTSISPPLYAQAPGFKFNLRHLLPKNPQIQELNVTDPVSVRRARQTLRTKSKLDPSQADAIIDTLTRDVSLIQGPPGTGKSYTGKEILRLLFASSVRPIVLMAFTNHALDHMLRAVLDENITNKIVRLGSRSSDERVSKYNLFELEKIADQSAMESTRRRVFRRMKEIEEEMFGVLQSIQMPEVKWSDIESYLSIQYPEAYNSFESPPIWISPLKKKLTLEAQEEGQWVEVKKRGKEEVQTIPKTNIGFWWSTLDISFISSSPPHPHNQSEVDPNVEHHDPTQENVLNFFASIGIAKVPTPPSPRRSAKSDTALLNSADVWKLNKTERRNLKKLWEDEVRKFAYNTHLNEFTQLRSAYEKACENYNNVKDQARKELLSNTDLIGCTTTGAAKLVSLMKAISPKVLMMEEAGQILESHTIAALVPSVQHMICIGDPQQLRPTLQNFNLSMDSEKGKILYKFDRSLMERLSDNGYPMSLINVQRRMRPGISRFPRLILYPTLEDNPIVLQYPPVQGIQSDVFFLTHTSREGGEQDSVSKYNMYEVEWIQSLVKYLLKQGPYGGKGDIAVLCAYLGQLQKVRAALRDAHLAVTVNERDQEELERRSEEEEEASAGVDQFRNVNVGQHIRLGTVDTFQGEEAKIVIISLVRNSGDFASDSSIGFLKIINRINVALSRAQHGMYILGNSSNLRKDGTWSTILDDLENHSQIGPTFPIVCPRHPHTRREISTPHELGLVAPEGGCLETCGHLLQCGHICKSVCHPDLNQHLRMQCDEPCPRITCPMNHPCELLCGEECGPCQFPIYNVRLKCHHIMKQLSCHESRHLEEVHCVVEVKKLMPFCEHTIIAQCSQDPSTLDCQAVCGEPVSCCSKLCKASCSSCMILNRNDLTIPPLLKRKVPRIKHIPHPCDRPLYCQHDCGVVCSQDHECNTECSARCRQSCIHQTCPKPCSEPCPPCMEQCSWQCEHHSCPVPCGSVCARLPCDIRCPNKLECNHPCPSICGEPCDQQKCIQCLPDSEQKEDIADFILQRKLCELELDSDDLSERIITLPCTHAFTVETLDGHCRMSEYYDISLLTGEYLAMKAPPVDYQTPPMCPTCRGPIKSPRYGRVTKRATLDILERNVASLMSKKITEAGVCLGQIQLKQLDDAIRAIPLSAPTNKKKEFDKIIEKRHFESSKATATPLPQRVLQTRKHHGFAPEEFTQWNNNLQPLLKSYDSVATLAKRKGPHVKCYEAALSTLYRRELAQLISNPETLAVTSNFEPEPQAMKEVEKKIGQPPHKADTRFQVEAFFITVQIRLFIIRLGLKRFDQVAKESSKVPSTTETSGEESVAYKEVWQSFIQFLVDSCMRDLGVAHDIAQTSSANRQVAHCKVLALLVEIESFKLEVMVSKRRSGQGPSDNKTLVKQIQKMGDSIIPSLVEIRAVYLNRIRPQQGGGKPDAVKWFEENLFAPNQAYWEVFEELENYVNKDVGLSMQEKADIVKAFNFGYRGHFYNCENGHTFVITECGGATQQARCPECGAPIGGSGHQLHGSNTRAMEYEEIARDAGSQNPHWQWGQGA